MSETLTIEERLRRFAAAPDDADWEDVLRRARLTTRRHRPRVTRRRLVAAIVVAALALAVPALALSGVLGSLFGLSNHGKPVHAGPVVRDFLTGRFWKEHGLPFGDPQNPKTFVRLAWRQGIGVYAAREEKHNTLCFYEGRRWSLPGQPEALHISFGPVCGHDVYGGNFALPARLASASQAKIKTWMLAHPFPSPARPVLDMSNYGERQTPWPKGAVPKPTPLPVPHWPKWSGRTGPILGPGQTLREARGNPTSEWPVVGPIVGVAANGVRSMQLLSLSDCHPVVTVPVIDNVYIDANPPAVAEAFIVARDGKGKIVWHGGPFENQFMHIPTERKAAPRNCGLG